MKIIITGATGFLGLHLAKHFADQGHEVIGIGRNAKKGEYLTQMNCLFMKLSIEDRNSICSNEVLNTLGNTDILIHSAALSSPWGAEEEFYKTNVLGTKNILELSLKCNVKKFIHISTPSLYFKFKDDFNISESTKLAPPFASLYSASKFEAEKLVDAANRESNLFTITLRPRGIFGPGDESLLPRLIKAAGTKGLPTIGDGKNTIDLTYVGNVVHAVEKAIVADAKCNGQKYNITNGEPILLWDFLNHIFTQLKMKTSTKKIPYKLAYTMALLLEMLHKYILKNSEPKLTRYTVGLLAKSQTLSIEKAKNELGYKPIVPMEKAIEIVIQNYK